MFVIVKMSNSLLFCSLLILFRINRPSSCFSFWLKGCLFVVVIALLFRLFKCKQKINKRRAPRIIDSVSKGVCVCVRVCACMDLKQHRFRCVCHCTCLWWYSLLVCFCFFVFVVCLKYHSIENEPIHSCSPSRYRLTSNTYRHNVPTQHSLSLSLSLCSTSMKCHQYVYDIFVSR